MMEDADVVQVADMFAYAFIVRRCLHKLLQYHGQRQEAKHIPPPMSFDRA